jgi:hypothetical protein
MPPSGTTNYISRHGRLALSTHNPSSTFYLWISTSELAAGRDTHDRDEALSKARQGKAREHSCSLDSSLNSNDHWSNSLCTLFCRSLTNIPCFLRLSAIETLLARSELIVLFLASASEAWQCHSFPFVLRFSLPSHGLCKLAFHATRSPGNILQ